MSATAAIGDAIMVGAVVAIVALEVRKHRRGSGQALVETALVLPVLLFAMLGIAEAAALFGYRLAYTNAAATVAAYAGLHGPTPAVEVSEAARTDCDAPRWTMDPYPPVPGEVVVVSLTCTYHPRIAPTLFDGLPVTVDASAVMAPTPSPEPSPSPDPSASIAP